MCVYGATIDGRSVLMQTPLNHETGFGKGDVGQEKVCTTRKYRHTYQKSVKTSNHITAHICVAGDGTFMSPFLIYEKSFPRPVDNTDKAIMQTKGMYSVYM
jgi:hypothetical protein